MHRIGPFIFLSVLLLLFPACANTSVAGNSQDFIIAVSIPPQVEFSEKVYDKDTDTVVLIPPGASPHTYEPEPSQLLQVSQADMYAMMGSGLEFELAWSEKIKDLNSRMMVVDCSEGIELIGSGNSEDANGTDPHIWLSLRNAKIITENIYEGLSEIDPENASAYYENLLDYHSDIDELDSRIKNIFEKNKVDTIMVLHPAWTYFARDYGLRQIAVEVEGKDPTPKSIESIIEEAKENGIKVIFASPEFSTKSADTIAEEIGGKVVLISPLEKDYLENMEKVAKVFSGGTL